MYIKAPHRNIPESQPGVICVPLSFFILFLKFACDLFAQLKAIPFKSVSCTNLQHIKSSTTSQLFPLSLPHLASLSYISLVLKRWTILRHDSFFFFYCLINAILPIHCGKREPKPEPGVKRPLGARANIAQHVDQALQLFPL